jgi:hypothetical protein
MRYRRVISWHILIPGVLVLLGCAASKVGTFTYDKRLLAEAEEKFEKRHYADALKTYQKLASSAEFANSAAAKTALYRTGYISMYYDNPKADPKAALAAFNTFKTRYPDDKLIGDVNTWISILVVLRSYEELYDETYVRMKKLQSKTAVTSGSLDTLIESFQRCSAEKDSLGAEKTVLLKKITELEQTIVKMEKTK